MQRVRRKSENQLYKDKAPISQAEFQFLSAKKEERCELLKKESS